MSAIITVAPRELRDLIERSARVAGADPGLAGLLARSAVRHEIVLGGAVAQLLPTLAKGDLAGLSGVLDSVANSEAESDDEELTVSSAYRHGLAVDGTLFAQLEGLAAEFLVAEETLDGLEAGP